jgi:ankyrin repeat protein
VKNLIEANADVNCKTNDGETPLQRAIKIDDAKLGDRKEIIDLLKKAGAK